MKQSQDFIIEKPDFKSPEDVLNWTGETFYNLFQQTRNEKASVRSRLLNQFIDGWSKIFMRYESGESLSELKNRLEQLEKSGELQIVK